MNFMSIPTHACLVVRIAISSKMVIAAPMDDRVLKLYDINGNKLARTPHDKVIQFVLFLHQESTCWCLTQCHKHMIMGAGWTSDDSLLTVDFDARIVAWRTKKASTRAGRRVSTGPDVNTL